MRAARAITTPLVPDDYLGLMNPAEGDVYDQYTSASGARPDEAHRVRVGDPGLEPGTSSLSETRSNQLS